MNIAVIFAGGIGSRMHSKSKPKQFLEICNKPVIIYTLEHFENNDNIDKIVISCIEEWIPYLKEIIYKFRISKVEKIVSGGETGQESIYNGLKAAKEISNDDKSIVLIHDGVRPLISSDLITQNIEDVRIYGSSITSGVVKETISIIDNDGYIQSVTKRENSRVAKAPQCFWLDEIYSCHEKARKEGRNDFIDSCTMMINYGYKLHITEGPIENIKITTPDDYYTMRAVIQAREDSQIYGL